MTCQGLPRTKSTGIARRRFPASSIIALASSVCPEPETSCSTSYSEDIMEASSDGSYWRTSDLTLLTLGLHPDRFPGMYGEHVQKSVDQYADLLFEEERQAPS